MRLVSYLLVYVYVRVSNAGTHIGTLRQVQASENISITLTDIEQRVQVDLLRIAEQGEMKERTVLSSLDLISDNLDVSLDEIKAVLSEERELLKNISVNLEPVLSKWNQLESKLNQVNITLASIETQLRSKETLFARISNEEAREFWRKYVKDQMDVRSSVFLQYLSMEYSLDLSPRAMEALQHLIDSNNDGFISLPDWIGFSEKAQSSSSFHDSILTYLTETRGFASFESYLEDQSIERILPSTLRTRDRMMGKDV